MRASLSPWYPGAIIRPGWGSSARREYTKKPMCAEC
jgi:hypothetical protein